MNKKQFELLRGFIDGAFEKVYLRESDSGYSSKFQHGFTQAALNVYDLAVNQPSELLCDSDISFSSQKKPISQFDKVEIEALLDPGKGSSLEKISDYLAGINTFDFTMKFLYENKLNEHYGSCIESATRFLWLNSGTLSKGFYNSDLVDKMKDRLETFGQHTSTILTYHPNDDKETSKEFLNCIRGSSNYLIVPLEKRMANHPLVSFSGSRSDFEMHCSFCDDHCHKQSSQTNINLVGDYRMILLELGAVLNYLKKDSTIAGNVEYRN